MNVVSAFRSLDLLLTQRDPQLDGCILENILRGWANLSTRCIARHGRCLRASQPFSEGNVIATLQLSIGTLPASLTNAALSKFYRFERKVNIDRCSQCRLYVNYYSRVDLTNRRIGINEVLGNNTYIHQKGCSCPSRWTMPLPNSKMYIIGAKVFLVATRSIPAMDQIVIKPHPRQLGERSRTSLMPRSLTPMKEKTEAGLHSIDKVHVIRDLTDAITTSCDDASPIPDSTFTN